MEQDCLLLGTTQMERMEAHPDSMQRNYVLVDTEHTCAARSEPPRRIKALLERLVVAVVVVSLLGIVAFLVYRANGAACQKMSSRKKMNITGPLKDRNQGECDIFTAEKTATYLIYVEVKFPDERDETEDFIFMKQSWKEKSTQTIHHKKHRYSDASIVEEVKVMQESRVYLLFNSGNPQCSESVFHVYEL